MKNKKMLLLLVVPGLLFLFFISLFIGSTTQPQVTESEATVRDRVQRAIREKRGTTRPIAIKALPTLPTANGGATDTNSPVVKESGREILKVYPQLPYAKDVTLSTGIPVSILIPGSEFQDASWKLTVQIFGINYSVLPEEKDYIIQKTSFLEASDIIFAWLASQDVDSKKVIIKWGDRAFIQEKATQWLSE